MRQIALSKIICPAYSFSSIYLHTILIMIYLFYFTILRNLSFGHCYNLTKLCISQNGAIVLVCVDFFLTELIWRKSKIDVCGPNLKFNGYSICETGAWPNRYTNNSRGLVYDISVSDAVHDAKVKCYCRVAHTLQLSSHIKTRVIGPLPLACMANTA